MNNYLKVNGEPTLIKDTVSGAIICNDSTAYQTYINRRDALNNDKTRLDTLEKDISEVKQLLQDLIGRLK